jgi:hypothetical protein
VSPPRHVSVRLQFAVNGFSLWGVFSPPRGGTGLFSLGWRGGVDESRVLCDAHLCLLQFHAGKFGASSLGRNGVVH